MTPGPCLSSDPSLSSPLLTLALISLEKAARQQSDFLA